jgi:limonene-1,2-epoxide hydrolase
MSDAMTSSTPEPAGPSADADPIEVVHRFLGALQRLDIDGAVALMTPDVTYQNVPLPAARGIDAVEKQLRWLARYGSGFEVEYINVAADGSTVLTERTDILVFGKLRAAFWVCGTFEVRDGKIALWRDRFDFVDVTWAFIRGGVKALLAGARA